MGRIALFPRDGTDSWPNVVIIEVMRRVWPLLVLAPLVIGGCGTAPEDRIVGIWTAIQEESFVPPVPVQGWDKQIRRFMRGFTVKLRSDHTFVIPAAAAAVEGKWKLEGERLQLKPGKGSLQGPMGAAMAELAGTVDLKRMRLTLEQPTPIGPVLIVLKKTG